jgi:hypothetical protein
MANTFSSAEEFYDGDFYWDIFYDADLKEHEEICDESGCTSHEAGAIVDM